MFLELYWYVFCSHPQDYDIVIWSATNMKWIEEKMKVLGCDSNPEYKLTFYLDSRAMISIHSQKYDKLWFICGNFAIHLLIIYK